MGIISGATKLFTKAVSSVFGGGKPAQQAAPPPNQSTFHQMQGDTGVKEEETEIEVGSGTRNKGRTGSRRQLLAPRRQGSATGGQGGSGGASGTGLRV